MQYPEHDRARAALHRLLAQRTDLLPVASRLVPSPVSRCWFKISEDETHNAWLIAWAPESALAAHDHGDSCAAVHVLRGGLIEWYRDRHDVAAWNVRELNAGTTILVPPARVHEVHNATRQRALSVHVYSPPLAVMNSFPAVGEIGGRAPEVVTA